MTTKLILERLADQKKATNFSIAVLEAMNMVNNTKSLKVYEKLEIIEQLERMDKGYSFGFTIKNDVLVRIDRTWDQKPYVDVTDDPHKLAGLLITRCKQ